MTEESRSPEVFTLSRWDVAGFYRFAHSHARSAHSFRPFEV